MLIMPLGNFISPEFSIEEVNNYSNKCVIFNTKHFNHLENNTRICILLSNYYLEIIKVKRIIVV